MNSNEGGSRSLPTAEETERVFQVARSLVPAAEAFARKNRLDPGTAHDAMEEAAKRVVAASPSPRKRTKPITNLPAYLFKVGRRLMIAQLQESKVEVPFENQDLPVNPVPNLERQILLSEIVSRMGPKARAVFRYRTLDYTYDEIAKEFKKMGYKATAASLRSELSKATRRITEELRSSDEDLIED
ncbi:MAG TPA: sigma-70 family RNA polymerase sigma factor [Pyrinomonadaceae bacterium]|nr:sigma-70 family RNA polymerase sigma factor [Pyrinomonadaceae bacterium]